MSDVEATDPSGKPNRMLFVLQDMLGPIVGGGRQRCWEIIRRASTDHACDVVVVAPPADVERDLADTVRAPNIRVFSYKDEAKGRRDMVRESPAASEKISELDRAAGGYRTVHVESFHLLPILPEDLLPRTVLAEENVESLLVRQSDGLRDELAGRWNLYGAELDAVSVAATEEYWWGRVRSVVALSPEDFDEIRRRRPDVRAYLVPNGWDHLAAPETTARPRAGRLRDPRLLFFADFDYLPNLDAAMWFATELAQRIAARLPEANLELGGVNPPTELLSAIDGHRNATWIGYIPSLPDKLAQADMVLCPIRVGGGVRVKVSETLYQGCLLISTTVGGWRWIPKEIRHSVLFAEDAEGFAMAVEELANSPYDRDYRASVLRAGRFALPTWDSVVAQLREIWQA